MIMYVFKSLLLLAGAVVIVTILTSSHKVSKFFPISNCYEQVNVEKDAFCSN